MIHLSLNDLSFIVNDIIFNELSFIKCFNSLSTSNLCVKRQSLHVRLPEGPELSDVQMADIDAQFNVSGFRTLSSLRGLRGAPEVPPLCRETQSLGQQMLELSCENTTVVLSVGLILLE